MRTSPTAALRSVRDSVRRLADATPPDRDRTVDLLRAFSIAVVVVWHWALSVTHWSGGELVMPNPIDEVPGAWLATWLLQVMPLFFLVGGFANLAAWDSTGAVGPFLRRRLARLLRPTAVFVGVWVLVESVLRLAVPGYPGVLHYGLVVFVPLWFLAAYLVVVLLTPLTAAAHRRAGGATVVLLGAAVMAVDLVRFGAGVEGAGLDRAGLVNTVLVWVFVHQLGYLWRDGFLDRAGRGALLTAGGLGALVVVALVQVYPRSMVATVDAELSHMFPTTAGIAALGVFQLGVLALLRPALAAVAGRPRVWRVVVAANAVIMTVFLWHMTALLLTVGALGWTGVPLQAEASATWWAQRPLWLALPAVVLAVLVAAFARAETRR